MGSLNLPELQAIRPYHRPSPIVKIRVGRRFSALRRLSNHHGDGGDDFA